MLEMELQEVEECGILRLKVMNHMLFLHIFIISLHFGTLGGDLYVKWEESE